MKRAFVAAIFVLSLAACGDDGTPAPEAEKAPSPEATAEATPPSESEPSGRTPAPADAKVFLIAPKDGDVVSSPVSVQFGVEGMTVAPAGTDEPNTGHHHLLIDTKLDDYNVAIPNDETHKHFGAGQTEASIELAPGKHTLQDVFGDKNHIPHDPPVESEVITITVE